jgi:hypothetical protein
MSCKGKVRLGKFKKNKSKFLCIFKKGSKVRSAFLFIFKRGSELRSKDFGHLPKGSKVRSNEKWRLLLSSTFSYFLYFYFLILCFEFLIRVSYKV